MHTIISPNILDENSFEYLVNQLPPVSSGEQTDISLDLSLAEQADSYALLGILVLGIYLRSCNFKTSLMPPSAENICQSMADTGFFRFCKQAYDVVTPCPEPKPSKSLLLRITPVEKSSDIHDIINTLRKSIRDSGLEAADDTWDNLLVMVSEICQNIPEHSQQKGYALINVCSDKTRHRNMVQLSVMDLGIGIKVSLDKKCFPVFRDKWSDQLAIQKTLFEGISRYDDPGRGNGIIRTRALVNRYHGKLSLRSGTAKLWGRIASWEFERFFRKPLTFLPGTQVNITIPI